MANNIFQKFREEASSGTTGTSSKTTVVFTATHKCIVFVTILNAAAGNPRETNVMDAGQTLTTFSGFSGTFNPSWSYEFTILELE